MSGVILAVVEHPGSAVQALVAARRLATLMGGARINVLAIRMAPVSTIMPTEEVLTSHQAGLIRAGEQVRVAALRTAFDGWAGTARSPGVVAEWIDMEGLADTLVAEWGRRSDFLVLNGLAGGDNVPDRLKLQAALFDTDRPVLVVPPGQALPFGQCVTIAWRDDKRTIRSVLAALRLLSQAREVHVLTGVHADSPEPALPEILAEHGIAAKLHVLPVGPGVFSETLMAKVHALGTDLLVMGAYTRSPWRQLVLGGVTRHMLANADLPVLMRH
jgi:nucleotide-binding universal stress UspA family protein